MPVRLSDISLRRSNLLLQHTLSCDTIFLIAPLDARSHNAMPSSKAVAFWDDQRPAVPPLRLAASRVRDKLKLTRPRADPNTRSIGPSAPAHTALLKKLMDQAERYVPTIFNRSK